MEIYVRAEAAMALTLIKGDEVTPVDILQVEARSLRRLALLSEARSLEREIGANPYSSYLARFSRRPPQIETEGMAKMLGVRLKADDENVYPLLTKSEKIRIRSDSQEFRRHFEQRRQAARILNIVEEIAVLDTKPKLTEHLTDNEGSRLVALLDDAVSCLFRIRTELTSEQARGQSVGGTRSPSALDDSP